MNNSSGGQRRIRWLLGLLMALSMIAAACGDSDDTNAGGDAGDDPTDDAGDDPTDDTGNGDDAGEPQQGGEIRFAATGETASLDPLDHGRASTTSFPMHMFYDSLMEITPEGEVVPFLAESLEPNDDLTSWTLTLRPDVTFHDDTPLDADAVIFNVNRFVEDETSNQYGIAQIESMEAVDELTVRFDLTEPFGAFPVVLALSPGFPVSPTAVEEMGQEQFALEGAIGTGPFVLTDRRIDSETVGERNPDYWQDGQPYLDRFVFQPITDAQTRYASVQAGDVDISQSNVPRQLAEAIEDDSLDEAIFRGNGGPNIRFNLREAPVDDVRVRQAMAHAINRDALDEVLYNGTMVHTCGPYEESSIWHAETECHDYDPDRARELLAEYEEDTGNEVAINFLCATNAGLPEQTELLHNFWTEVGIDVTIDQVEPLTQLERIRADPPQFQVACWFGDFNVDPDERLRIFFHSEGETAQADGYSNPVVDEAFEAGRATADFDERYEQYAIVQEEISQDLSQVFWTIRLDGAIFQPQVKGVEIVPGGGFWPGRVWVEE